MSNEESVTAEGIVEALRAGHPGASIEELQNIAQTTCAEYASGDIEADRLYDEVCKLLEE